MSAVSLAEVKARLNKTTPVDDVELQEMIDRAEAEYAELIGPVGEQTLRLDGGSSVLILPRHAAVSSVAYDDDTAVTDLDFDPASGLLRRAGGYSFGWGQRNVVVTLAVELPANHREVIVADVAGYFAATQRGPATGSALPGQYGVPIEAEAGAPLTLWPRIRALAGRYPSIA